MGAVYDEFLRELAVLERRHASRPRRLLIDLFLMALEREEIVSVAYRDSLMAARLSSMPLPDDVRDLIRHALIWAWKDEEMHSIYIRGAILKLGDVLLRIQAFARQTAGSVGGVQWAECVSPPWLTDHVADSPTWMPEILNAVATLPGSNVSTCCPSKRAGVSAFAAPRGTVTGIEFPLS